MPLFQRGNFRSHSGLPLDWKIECDALTDEDWDCLAMLAARILPSFCEVEGVPTGGQRFAKALSYHARSWGKLQLLIADDVCTTGASLEKQRGDREAIGIVAFSRSRNCPAWVTPIWTLHDAIW